MSLIMDAARIKDESPAEEKHKVIGPADRMEIEIEKLESDDEFTSNINNYVGTALEMDASDSEQAKQKKEEPKKTKKRIVIDTKKLKDLIKALKQDLGEGLLSLDIFVSVSGKSLAGFNTNSQVNSLFNRLTGSVRNALKKSEFPGLGSYYILDLEDGKMVVVIPFFECQCGMLIDPGKIQIALLFDVVIPQVFGTFDKAFKRRDV